MTILNQTKKKLCHSHRPSYHTSISTIPIPIHHIQHNYHSHHDILLEEAQTNLSQIMKSYHHEQKPILIRNFYNNQNENGTLLTHDDPNNNNHNTIPCRAIQHWSDLNYLQNIIGKDTNVFVEIGGSYNQTATANSRAEIQFGDYISYIQFFHEKYGFRNNNNYDDINTQNEEDEDHTPSQEEIVYMAQNDIATFTFQSQHTRTSSSSSSSTIHNDYTIPKLCYDPTLQIGNGQIYNSMFWFGR